MGIVKDSSIFSGSALGADIGGLKRGDVVRVGKTKWIVFRALGTFQAWVYKHPSKHAKMYELIAAGREGDLYEVWAIGGSAQRTADKPEVVGAVEVVGHEEF